MLLFFFDLEPNRKVPVVRSCGPDECYGPKSASGLHRAALRHVLRVEVRDAYPLVLRLRSNVIRSAVLLPRRRSDTPVKDVRYLDQRSQYFVSVWRGGGEGKWILVL